ELLSAVARSIHLPCARSGPICLNRLHYRDLGSGFFASSSNLFLDVLFDPDFRGHLHPDELLRIPVFFHAKHYPLDGSRRRGNARVASLRWSRGLFFSARRRSCI